MKKKILFINLATFSQIGGIENYNKNIIKALENMNIILDVISVYDREEFPLKNGYYYAYSGNKIKASFFIIKNISKYDIILASHINLLPLLIISKILYPKIDIFLSAHGIEVWKKFSFFKRFFLRKITILPVSNYTKNLMKIFNNFFDTNFKLLFNSIELNEQVNYFSKNIYNHQDFNLLSVSRLDKNDNYKGIDSVIKTIPLLIKQIPNLKYTIVGKGDDKDRLEKLAKDLNVEEYVKFKGFVENVEPYYQHCDIFILPSKGEGFGIVYLEAMKYKKPCIACDEGGQTDVVLDNKTGYLCKYDNVECLASKVIDLYKNVTKRKQFGENGYKHLIDNFTFEKFQKRLKIILALTK